MIRCVSRAIATRKYVDMFRQKRHSNPDNETSRGIHSGSDNSGLTTTPKDMPNNALSHGKPNSSKMTSSAKGNEESVKNGHFDFDLFVIGGGSGGIACSKEAVKLGLKVACADFVDPSAKGTTWGLGGTCVNVGCIPKKLMHQASLLNEAIEDASHYGWTWNVGVKPEGENSQSEEMSSNGTTTPLITVADAISKSVGQPVDSKVIQSLESRMQVKASHKWSILVSNIQDHVRSLNFGYRSQFREKGITYLNEKVTFREKNSVETTDRKGKKTVRTAKNFLIAAGGRPNYPDIPGINHCITSDDIFSLSYNPGVTLCVGASYISLECAGFLKSLGFPVTVLVRSILLRGFDQQMAETIGKTMEARGIQFIYNSVLDNIELLEPATEDNPPRLRVAIRNQNKQVETMDVNTVLLAIGRSPNTASLGLQNAGVATDPESFKILTDTEERTSTNHIYALGDIAKGRPELTPAAIYAGILLARRLAGKSTKVVDYNNVPTTVFTPLEYGCVGLSEEKAIECFGEDDIEVYHTNFTPLEATIPHRDENSSYVKIICKKSDDERLLGFHYLGPNAGEVTQGFAVALRMNAKKSDLDDTIGIHPTCAELMTSMEITKSSGESPLRTGC